MVSIHAHVGTLAITLLLYRSLENIEMLILRQALLRLILWSSCNAKPMVSYVTPLYLYMIQHTMYIRVHVWSCACAHITLNTVHEMQHVTS